MNKSVARKAKKKLRARKKRLRNEQQLGVASNGGAATTPDEGDEGAVVALSEIQPGEGGEAVVVASSEIQQRQVGETATAGQGDGAAVVALSEIQQRQGVATAADKGGDGTAVARFETQQQQQQRQRQAIMPAAEEEEEEEEEEAGTTLSGAASQSSTAPVDVVAPPEEQDATPPLSDDAVNDDVAVVPKGEEISSGESASISDNPQNQNIVKERKDVSDDSRPRSTSFALLEEAVAHVADSAERAKEAALEADRKAESEREQKSEPHSSELAEVDPDQPNSELSSRFFLLRLLSSHPDGSSAAFDAFLDYLLRHDAVSLLLFWLEASNHATLERTATTTTKLAAKNAATAQLRARVSNGRRIYFNYVDFPASVDNQCELSPGTILPLSEATLLALADAERITPAPSTSSGPQRQHEDETTITLASPAVFEAARAEVFSAMLALLPNFLQDGSSPASIEDGVSSSPPPPRREQRGAVSDTSVHGEIDAAAMLATTWRWIERHNDSAGATEASATDEPPRTQQRLEQVAAPSTWEGYVGGTAAEAAGALWECRTPLWFGVLYCTMTSASSAGGHGTGASADDDNSMVDVATSSAPAATGEHLCLASAGGRVAEWCILEIDPRPKRRRVRLLVVGRLPAESDCSTPQQQHQHQQQPRHRGGVLTVLESIPFASLRSAVFDGGNRRRVLVLGDRGRSWDLIGQTVSSAETFCALLNHVSDGTIPESPSLLCRSFCFRCPPQSFKAEGPRSWTVKEGRLFVRCYPGGPIGDRHRASASADATPLWGLRFVRLEMSSTGSAGVLSVARLLIFGVDQLWGDCDPSANAAAETGAVNGGAVGLVRGDSCSSGGDEWEGIGNKAATASAAPMSVTSTPLCVLDLEGLAVSVNGSSRSFVLDPLQRSRTLNGTAAVTPGLLTTALTQVSRTDMPASPSAPLTIRSGGRFANRGTAAAAANQLSPTGLASPAASVASSTLSLASGIEHGYQQRYCFRECVGLSGGKDGSKNRQKGGGSRDDWLAALRGAGVRMVVDQNQPGAGLSSRNVNRANTTHALSSKKIRSNAVSVGSFSPTKAISAKRQNVNDASSSGHGRQLPLRRVGGSDVAVRESPRSTASTAVGRHHVRDERGASALLRQLCGELEMAESEALAQAQSIEHSLAAEVALRESHISPDSSGRHEKTVIDAMRWARRQSVRRRQELVEAKRRAHGAHLWGGPYSGEWATTVPERQSPSPPRRRKQQHRQKKQPRPSELQQISTDLKKPWDPDPEKGTAVLADARGFRNPLVRRRSPLERHNAPSDAQWGGSDGEGHDNRRTARVHDPVTCCSPLEKVSAQKPMAFGSVASTGRGSHSPGSVYVSRRSVRFGAVDPGVDTSEAATNGDEQAAHKMSPPKRESRATRLDKHLVARPLSRREKRRRRVGVESYVIEEIAKRRPGSPEALFVAEMNESSNGSSTGAAFERSDVRVRGRRKPWDPIPTRTGGSSSRGKRASAAGQKRKPRFSQMVRMLERTELEEERLLQHHHTERQQNQLSETSETAAEAVRVARTAMATGRYEDARMVLSDLYCHLRQQNADGNGGGDADVLNETKKMLRAVHCWLEGSRLSGDNSLAAPLLMTAADSIDLFPRDITRVLGRAAIAAFSDENMSKKAKKYASVALQIFEECSSGDGDSEDNGTALTAQEQRALATIVRLCGSADTSSGRSGTNQHAPAVTPPIPVGHTAYSWNRSPEKSNHLKAPALATKPSDVATLTGVFGQPAVNGDCSSESAMAMICDEELKLDTVATHFREKEIKLPAVLEETCQRLGSEQASTIVFEIAKNIDSAEQPSSQQLIEIEDEVAKVIVEEAAKILRTSRKLKLLCADDRADDRVCAEVLALEVLDSELLEHKVAPLVALLFTCAASQAEKSET